MNRQIIERILEDIQFLLDEPSSGFQDEGERWEQIVNLIEDMLKELKK